MKGEGVNNTASIVANGKPLEIALPCSVTDFLAERNLKPTQVVVEYNGEALLRDQFEQVQLREGDRLEVVLPVAGG
jgi:thiamine biosynthesis protein ThiS